MTAIIAISLGEPDNLAELPLGMRNEPTVISHNREVTSTSFSPGLSAPVVNRPSVVAVGTIVWLGSEVMFFAGLFAIYFTLRSTQPELWAFETPKLNVPYALVNTIILVASSFTAQFGVFAAERLQKRRTGASPVQWGMESSGDVEGGTV
jgi:hypothetical protein